MMAAGFMVVCVVRFAGTTIWLALCWFCAVGALLTVVDLEERRLPTRMVGALAGGGVALLTVSAATENDWIRLVSAMAAAIATFSVAMVVQLAAPGHTGGGDTKLYAALALYLGWWGWAGLIMGLLCATALTALVALVVLVRNGGQFGTKFPAGPSLILGAVIGMLIA
ncbi:prepilin peptidase [Amycolatopsis sp. NPDC059657]|uniref:prepilin peptidase n=1 Tax=Amycolatopsis sp. NPDC059657 TaxID=3346899 RepID=UPI00366F5F5A